MSHWGLVIIFWCSYIWWRWGKRVFLGGGAALGSNQHRWSDVPLSRPLWPNGRPSECGATTLWINTIPTKKTKPNKTKKARAGTWSYSGADRLGSRWSLNYNVLPMTYTHTHPCILSLWGIFLCSVFCKYIQEHLLTAEDVKTCRENAISRFPAGFFFYVTFIWWATRLRGLISATIWSSSSLQTHFRLMAERRTCLHLG